MSSCATPTIAWIGVVCRPYGMLLLIFITLMKLRLQKHISGVYIVTFSLKHMTDAIRMYELHVRKKLSELPDDE